MTDESRRPLALDAYEALADAFAERAPTKPFNAELERPTTYSLLPDVDGLDVLDAGCGPGITSKHLVTESATVVGIDVSPSMLEHARERVGEAAEFLQADLGEPLPFGAGRFDLVYSSLAFDYVENWEQLFGELARVLRPGGNLVFSCGHPIADYLYFEPEDYFATEQVSAVWDGFGDPVDVPTYRRPFAATVNPLLAAGFQLERLAETKPTERFRELDPETYERVSRQPTFISVRARLRS